jgi:hypothetical protein
MINFFDKELAIGFLFLLFLSVSTIFALFKSGIRDKKIYIIFAITLLIHSGVALFIYYANFNPFGGGADYQGYHNTAVELSHRFSRLDFSLDGLYAEHFFPVLVGIIYMFTLPSAVVGQLFVAWLAAISVLLVYAITVEIGGSKKISFLVGLIANIYPSYLFFGSVLLKDTLVIPLVFSGMLLSIKMFKNFTWVKFLMFFTALTALINLRFYIGYALMFSFVFCWFLISRFNFRRRAFYGFFIIFLLGFSPYILGNGYYGLNNFIKFLNPKAITYYREVVYNSSDSPQPQPAPQPAPQPQPASEVKGSGEGSNFLIKTGFDEGYLSFSQNYMTSFIYSLLGPFPWQFRYKRQIIALVETIPWYLLLLVCFYGTVRLVKKNGLLNFLKFYRLALPLIVFGLIALAALSLFINNYGIIARIRIPAFLSFLSAISIIFNNEYEKIFNHGRSWIYRLSSFRGIFKIGA